MTSDVLGPTAQIIAAIIAAWAALRAARRAAQTRQAFTEHDAIDRAEFAEVLARLRSLEQRHGR